jgi:hypothetical protein
MKLLKSDSHMGIEWVEAENSSFSQLHLTLVGLLWDYVRAYFKKNYMQNCFAKQVSKTALASPR